MSISLWINSSHVLNNYGGVFMFSSLNLYMLQRKNKVIPEKQENNISVQIT